VPDYSRILTSPTRDPDLGEPRRAPGLGRGTRDCNLQTPSFLQADDSRVAGKRPARTSCREGRYTPSEASAETSHKTTTLNIHKS